MHGARGLDHDVQPRADLAPDPLQGLRWQGLQGLPRQDEEPPAGQEAGRIRLHRRQVEQVDRAEFVFEEGEPFQVRRRRGRVAAVGGALQTAQVHREGDGVALVAHGDRGTRAGRVRVQTQGVAVEDGQGRQGDEDEGHDGERHEQGTRTGDDGGPPVQLRPTRTTPATIIRLPTMR